MRGQFEASETAKVAVVRPARPVPAVLSEDENHWTDTRLDPAGKTHANRAGLAWHIGERVSHTELCTVAESMTDDLVTALTMPTPPPDVLSLYLTDPVSDLQGIEGIVFSGGVAEFFYGREKRNFGDLGHVLGTALRERVDTEVLPWPLIAHSQGIRATALGGSEFTAQLSGNTGYISDPNTLLPRRNVQVVRPDFKFSEDFDVGHLAREIGRHMKLFDLEEADADIVLAFHWEGEPTFQRIKALAEGISRAMIKRIENGKPIYVILDADIALNLGALLKEELGVPNELFVVDGLVLGDFDYVDLGRIQLPSHTVPVTIKSLIFRDAPGGARGEERIQHRPYKEQRPRLPSI